MTPSSARLLLGAASVAGVLAAVLLRAVYASLPALPSGPVLTEALAAALLGLAARAVRARRAGRGRALPPLAAARFAAAGRAAALAGAVLAGVWSGAAVFLVVHRALAAARADLPRAVAAAAVALLLLGAGLALETACRVRGGPDDYDPDS